MGARKILKSQKSESISAELLGHAAEEIRHAQILKHFTLKLSNGYLDSYRDEHLLCGTEAWSYLQSIDEAAALELSDRGTLGNYLLTTVLTEERALIVYPIIERILKERAVPNAIGSIIRDEDAHLASIKSMLNRTATASPAMLKRLRTIEHDWFCDFIMAVQREIKTTNRKQEHEATLKA